MLVTESMGFRTVFPGAIRRPQDPNDDQDCLCHARQEQNPQERHGVTSAGMAVGLLPRSPTEQRYSDRQAQSPGTGGRTTWKNGCWTACDFLFHLNMTIFAKTFRPSPLAHEFLRSIMV